MSLSLNLGLGLSSAGGGAAIPTEDQLAALLLGSGKSAMWLPTGGSDLYSDSARTTPITAGGGSAVGAVDDYSGNGYHLLQATSGLRPLATNGLTFDGADDSLSAAVSGNLSANTTLLCGIKTTDTVAVVFASGPSGFDPIIQNGSVAALGAGVYVDDVQPSPYTRGGAYTEISNNAWHRLELRNRDHSARGSIGLSTASDKLAGAISCFIMLDANGLGADYAEALSLSQTLIDEINAGL